MQQEKTSLSVAEYFRTPVDLSLSLCSGPDHFGVDKQCLMGYNFYAAEAFSCRGFLSQKVLLRFISFDDIAHCLTFSSSVAFAKQTIVKVSDLGESFLGELKKDNKYPFLTQEDQSALKHDDQLYVQVIDHGISLSVSHKNNNDRIGMLEEFIALVSICLNTYRICPTSISLESFLITDENNACALRWIPLMPLNDLYTDNDIVVLLNRLSGCAFFLACPSDTASLKELYLQQLAIASAAADNLKEGIDLDTSAIRELAEFGIDIGILHECLKLGIPFTSGSYFNGSCSISESLNRFLEKIKL
ncbi:MAG: hypothetical protein OEX19_11560, partial [Gammaproteobacteria bacterium]|nr:hypothetical protein [Gammaproteobacteria bacterium]